MKFLPSKRRPPFETLPRHQRSEEVVRLKSRMRRDAAQYGGRFTSRLVLHEPGRPDLYNQWFDFYFPGTDRFTIWNASLVTARKAFWDKTHEIAHAQAAAMLTQQELQEESTLELVPAQRTATGKILTYELAHHPEARYAQFGGLTLDEQGQKLESQIIRNEPPEIYESFELECGYAYGRGVKMVLDREVIDQEAIEEAIDRFLGIGQTDWMSPEPVPRHRLPYVSEDAALATLSPEQVFSRASQRP